MKGGHRVRQFWAAALLALAFLSTACANGASTTPGTAPVGGTITMRLIDSWGTLDILTQLPRQTALRVTTALYDRLIARAKDGKLIPYLAESWQQTPTTITFTLRRGPTCADGTPLSATAVADWLKAYGEKNKAQAARYFGTGALTVVGNDSARTVTVTLPTAKSDAIYAFSGTQLPVVCPKGVADPKILDTGSSGSGPFEIDATTPATVDTLTLRSRPDWNWGPYGVTAKSAGFPQKLVFRVVANETTTANLLLTGGLDLAEEFSGPDTHRLLAEKGLTTRYVDSFYAYPMVMNEQPGRVTADEKVREALMTAVDRAEYTQAGYSGLSKPATSMFESSWECYEPAVEKLLPQQPSPDRARSILLGAGYTAGPDGKLQKDGKPLTINLLSNAEGAPDYLLDRFTKAGITVKYDFVDQNQNSIRVRSGNYDVAIQRASTIDQNPSAAITLFSGPLPPAGTNYSFIIDPTLDQLVTKAGASIGSERCHAWRDVQRRWIERHHLLPLSFPRFYAFSRNIDFVMSTYPEPASLKRIK